MGVQTIRETPVHQSNVKEDSAIKSLFRLRTVIYGWQPHARDCKVHTVECRFVLQACLEQDHGHDGWLITEGTALCLGSYRGHDRFGWRNYIWTEWASEFWVPGLQPYGSSSCSHIVRTIFGLSVLEDIWHKNTSLLCSEHLWALCLRREMAQKYIFTLYLGG